MEFCDDNFSQYSACDKLRKTKNNKFCDGKSLCELIDKSPDLYGIAPLNGKSPPNTEFNILRSNENARYVLVLDVSTSMGRQINDYNTCRRIDMLKKAAKHFLKQNSSQVNDGDYVGVVTFRYEDSIISNLRLRAPFNT